MSEHYRSMSHLLSSPSPHAEAPASSASGLTLAALMLMLVLAALDQTILSTALASIRQELPGNLPSTWTFSAYLLSATIVIPLYGRLADVYGRKSILLSAVALFLLGSSACAASQSMLQLVLARAIQGAGGGGLMTLAMLVVASMFAPQERGRYQAMLGAIYGIATMFGPLLGGWLTEHLSWRWAFGLNVPLTLVAWLVLASTLRPRPAGQPTPIDHLGAFLLSLALCSALLMTQRERLLLPEWLSMSVLGAVCALSAAAFVLRQQQTAHPLVPLALFTRPAYAAIALIGLLGGLALYAAVVFVPVHLQTTLHLSPMAAAWHLLPLMGGLTAAAIASGRLLRARVSARGLGTLASGLVVAGFALLTLTIGVAPSQPLALSACLLPLGAGIGMLLPLVTVVSQRAAPPQFMGVATAVPVMLRSLGGAVGVALLTLLQSAVLPLATLEPSAGDVAAVPALQWVWGCTAALTALGLLACRWLPGASLEQTHGDAGGQAGASKKAAVA
jgi:EmrB/QacA subfamily drug resistance transporter